MCRSHAGALVRDQDGQNGVMVHVTQALHVQTVMTYDCLT